MPGHVHVYRDGKEVLRWDIENSRVIAGKATSHLLRLIGKLEADGLL